MGPLAKLFEAILELTVPLIMASMIDNVELGVEYVAKNAAFVVVIGIVGLGSALVCQYMGSKASQEIGTDLRNVVFEKINTYSNENLDRFGSSTLITRITTDINQVQTAVAMFIRLAVRAPFLIIGAAVMACFIDLRLSAVFILLIPLIALTLLIVTKKTIPLYGSIQAKLDRLTSRFSEQFSGVRVIRAFNTQDYEEARFEKTVEDFKDEAIKTAKISSALNPLTALFTGFSIAAVLYFGSFQIESGTLTAGDLIAFVGYLTQISLSLGIVANLIVLFTKAAASAKRIVEVLDAENIQNAIDSNVNAADKESLIQFSNVSFRYSGANEDTLSDISFNLGYGETLAILGNTGSGKSTLINLIPRFYESDSGVITFAGRDIREYDNRELREQIRVVPQTSLLFSGTVIDNLKFGDKNADEKAAVTALETACLEGISHDSPVSAGGKNFSGGQRQRLAIARAIIHTNTPPKLLIFDNSFSALDGATARRLRENLKKHLPDTAFIVITERINSIVDSDVILVLDDGRVIGSGKHEELLSNCEKYRDIYESQQ
ncbi:MAG: ABC transporter ATP-binding protein/permease [Ruminococcus sp.]|nr:ABC transporter ATP-binding protein/permease [Ruminococcus sp.]